MQNDKVCIITTVHNAFDNRIYHKQIKSLVKYGYEVSLIAQSELKKEVINDDGVRIIPLPIIQKRLQRFFLLNWLALIKARSEKAVVYHFHDPELIPVGLVLKLSGGKVIYDIHEDYITSIAQKSYMPKCLQIVVSNLVGLLEQIAAKAFHLILAEKYYSKRFPKGIQVLNYPRSELFSFSPNYQKTDKPKLLYTGVVDEDRGALIHANILNYIDDVELYLIGRCSNQLAVKLYSIVKKNKERLQIVGIGRHVPFEEIIKYYKMDIWTAALAIFPPTPHYMNKELTKFFEYMAAGIPVICSDFPVWKMVIGGERAGITVNPEDQEMIREAIEKLYINEDKGQQMGQNGNTLVNNKYNWQNEEVKLINYYKSIINET